MIFGAFGLLALAVAMLIAAIVKSSVAFGVAALILTVGAGVCIVMANAYYRKLTHEKPDELRQLATDPTVARTGDGAMAPAGTMPAYAGNGHTMYLAPPPGAVMTMTGPPIEGYDALNVTQATT